MWSKSLAATGRTNMAYEVTRAAEWIYTQLSGNINLVNGLGTNADGGPNIFHRLANPTAHVPYVVFTHFGGPGDVQTIDTRRIWSQQLWQVKLIVEGTDDAAIEPLADLIDASLQARRGAVLDGKILNCWRERTLELAEQVQDVLFMHIIGEYTLLVAV